MPNLKLHPAALIFNAKSRRTQRCFGFENKEDLGALCDFAVQFGPGQFHSPWMENSNCAILCSFRAGVAELADAPDSKSGETYLSCGFDPHLQHQLSPFRIIGL